MAAVHCTSTNCFKKTSEVVPSKTDVPFRELIPASDHWKVKSLTESTASEWYSLKKEVPELAWFLKRFELANLDRSYTGFTTTGQVEDDVFDHALDEGAPIEAMVAAAERILSISSREQKEATLFESVEADEMRIWSNPELYVNPGGLRLDECTTSIQAAVHSLLKASLSPEGYAKILGCCLTNDFLGELINGKKVLNEHSYNFRLFGHPSIDQPWAYGFFGHHLCLAVFIQNRRMVIGPTFLGAEPDCIDSGPHQGLRLFKAEELLALKLMQSLPPEMQARATLSVGMDGKSLPEGRWNPYDERHLGGATQDNRVVPCGRSSIYQEFEHRVDPSPEGCPVSSFPPKQQEQVVSLFKAFNEYYPHKVLEHRIRTFRAHLSQTYFAWIGKFGDDDPYYYRIHSPVTFLEFDFHCGVFLTNTTPAKCHIHTINRLPNRGDYGRALLAQYRKEKEELKTCDICMSL